jgi:hypothetical protein
MDRLTRIVPPIRFASNEGDAIVIGCATTLVDHLDRLYDAILDPQRREQHLAGALRTQHLDAIERLLFLVTEEMGRGAALLGETLRSQAVLLIGQYRPLDIAAEAAPVLPGRADEASRLTV